MEHSQRTRCTKRPEQFSIVSSDNGIKQEYEIEISEREKKLFALLDRFGEIGRDLLQDFYERYLPSTLTQDSLDGNFNITLELDSSNRLTPSQRELLKSIYKQIIRDHQNLVEKLGKLSREALLRQLHEDLLAQGEGEAFDSEKVSVAVVPGGIGLLIHDRDYFDQNFPKAESTVGFYNRKGSYARAAKFPGRIFVVDTTNETAIGIFCHEYLHLLTENYLEPHEIAPNLPEDALPIQEEIDQLRAKITELQEEAIYAEYDEALALDQQISVAKERIAALQQIKKEMIDRSQSYVTAEALRLFKDVRDELCAYAVTGEFNTTENTLIPRKATWPERIGQITDENDRNKLIKQWRKLKLVISFVQKRGIPANDVLHIFLTSQNLEQITKRLLLFTQENQPNKKSAV